MMRTMQRKLSLSCMMANIALLDIVEGLGHCNASKDADGKYRFTMEVYTNLCGFAAQAHPYKSGSVLIIELEEPSPGLSDAGQTRTLRYLLAFGLLVGFMLRLILGFAGVM